MANIDKMIDEMLKDFTKGVTNRVKKVRKAARRTEINRPINKEIHVTHLIGGHRKGTTFLPRHKGSRRAMIFASCYEDQFKELLDRANAENITISYLINKLLWPDMIAEMELAKDRKERKNKQSKGRNGR
jgi:hypothetical protein